MAKQLKGRGVDAKAVVNNVKINSLPSSTYAYSSGEEIVPFGLDNIYPQRIFEAVTKSPTASGCAKRTTEFIMGLGVENGEEIVNRRGETLNQVLAQCERSYSVYGGFAIHFNFNILGQITEMTNVDLRYIRKTRDLEKAVIAEWERKSYGIYQDTHAVIDLYNPDSLPQMVKKAKGIKKYNGQLLYFSADGNIYPTAPIDSASVAANYEEKSQIYSYANINNGFSGTTIVKIPNNSIGSETQEEISEGASDDSTTNSNDKSPMTKMEQSLESLHGAENTGSSLVIEVPTDANGTFHDFTMVENLTPTNVDDLYLNQDKKQEENIFKSYTMPKILLGVSDQGMFNEASFNDAFNYKNADTEGDRKVIERVFNSFLPRTVFDAKQIVIVPLKMKGDAAFSGEITEEGGQLSATGDIPPEQLAAQANLRGSVGGVQGILEIQRSFTEGTTSKVSALSILELIYGFSNENALRLLGNPKDEKSKKPKEKEK
jgi:hypothetical protein